MNGLSSPDERSRLGDGTGRLEDVRLGTRAVDIVAARSQAL